MAKYVYKALKDIDKRIYKELANLGLSRTSSVKKCVQGKLKFYFSTPERNGRKVMFKARIADHRVLKKAGKDFSLEIHFLKTLAKYYPNDSLTESVPVYLKSEKHRCEWLMCEFIDAETIGSTDLSYDRNPNTEDILKIVNLLLDIQQFDISHFKQHHRWAYEIGTNTGDKYLASFDQFIKVNHSLVNRIFDPSTLKQARKTLQSSVKIIDKNCNILVHGDFHPANIFIYNNRAIAIDWESLRIGNSASDIMTLWQRMAHMPELRKLLLLEYAKSNKQKKDFPRLFRANGLLSLLGEATFLFTRMHEPNDPIVISQLKKSFEVTQNNYLKMIKNESIDDYD